MYRTFQMGNSEENVLINEITKTNPKTILSTSTCCVTVISDQVRKVIRSEAIGPPAV